LQTVDFSLQHISADDFKDQDNTNCIDDLVDGTDEHSDSKKHYNLYPDLFLNDHPRENLQDYSSVISLCLDCKEPIQSHDAQICSRRGREYF